MINIIFYDDQSGYIHLGHSNDKKLSPKVIDKMMRELRKLLYKYNKKLL